MANPVYLKPLPATVEDYKDWARRAGIELTPSVLRWLPDAISRGNRRASEEHQRKLNEALAKAGS